MTDKTFLVIAVGDPVPVYSCFIGAALLSRVVRGAPNEKAAALAVKTELQNEYPGQAFREFAVIETTRIRLDGGPLGAHLVAEGPSG
jgi:hypothetical protein